MLVIRLIKQLILLIKRVSLNPGVLQMKDQSRTDFDNAISVRLEAAEEIPLMSPYFRVKYIIKAV